MEEDGNEEEESETDEMCNDEAETLAEAIAEAVGVELDDDDDSKIEEETIKINGGRYDFTAETEDGEEHQKSGSLGAALAEAVHKVVEEGTKISSEMLDKAEEAARDGDEATAEVVHVEKGHFSVTVEKDGVSVDVDLDEDATKKVEDAVTSDDDDETPPDETEMHTSGGKIDEVLLVWPVPNQKTEHKIECCRWRRRGARRKNGQWARRRRRSPTLVGRIYPLTGLGCTTW